MRKLFLAVTAGALMIGASACNSGTQHVAPAGAMTSAPVATSATSGGTDVTSLQNDLNGVSRDLSSVDGQLSQTDGDLSSSNESDVQR